MLVPKSTLTPKRGILPRVRGRGPRVLICDDAPGYRLLTQTVLEEAGFEVAGTAGSWDEAEERAAELRPDVMLLDLWLPEFDEAAIRRVCESADGCLIAVVSALDEERARRMVDGVPGIDMVLSKRESPTVLVEALRRRL